MEIVILVLFTFIAATVGTTTSFGTATFMVPVLTFFYPLDVALLFTGIIHWFGNIWKMVFFHSGFRWKLILLFGLPGIVASYVGAMLVPDISETIVLRLLGGFFIVYVIFLLTHQTWKIRASTPNAMIGGMLSGVSAGLFGVGGAIRAAFLSAYHLEKAVFIFTAGVIGLFIDSGRIIEYIRSDVTFTNPLWLALAFCLPASLLGGYVGKRLTGRIPERKFRLVIGIVLLLIGVKYLIWP